MYNGDICRVKSIDGEEDAGKHYIWRSSNDLLDSARYEDKIAFINFEDHSDYSSNGKFSQNYSLFEDSVVFSKSMKKFQKDWENMANALIRSDFVISCEQTVLGDFIDATFDSYRNNLGFASKLVSDYYTKIVDDDQKVIYLLHAISRVEYSKIGSCGLLIAGASLSHTNVEVVENALKAFENWGSYETLAYLKKVRSDVFWISNYVDKIIAFIEEVHSNDNCKKD